MNGTIGFLRAGHLDCPNNSAYLTEAELQRMRVLYQELVAKGAVIPPYIATLAKRLGVAD